MPETPPPESLRDALDGRLASLVHIMRGRRSLFSHLGVLELNGGALSLWDASGGLVFGVPAGVVQAQPQRRRTAVHQFFFQVHDGDRWWCLTGAVLTQYSRSSTRALVERYAVTNGHHDRPA